MKGMNKHSRKGEESSGMPLSGWPALGLSRIATGGWKAGMLRVSKGGRKGRSLGKSPRI